MDDQIPVAPPVTATPTTPAGTNLNFDALHNQFADALAAMNVEPVDHTASDQQLSQAGFAGIIDVVLYKAVVAGTGLR